MKIGVSVSKTVEKQRKNVGRASGEPSENSLKTSVFFFGRKWIDQSRGHCNKDSKTQSPLKEGDHHSGGHRPPHDLAGTHRQRQENPVTQGVTQRPALAAAHPRMAPHLKRQACSTRFRRSGTSRRDRALANCARKDLVSDDHLPPTSIAKTTKRARLRGPTNSGYRRSFRLRAAVRTTPSRSAAPWCGEPSQCMAHTSVVSIASWHPP